MPIFNLSSFASKVHFHIKYNMTRRFEPSNWRFLLRPKNFKCNTDITHLVCEGICPERVPISVIQVNGIPNRTGKLNAVLVRAFPYSWIYRWDDDITLLQNIWYPPCKCRVLMNSTRSGILSHLDGIWFFQDLQIYPLAQSIVPLNQKFSPFSSLLHAFSPTRGLIILVFHQDRIIRTFMINDVI